MLLDSPGETYRLTAEYISYTFSRYLPPAIHVQPGDFIQVETLDARAGQVLTGHGDSTISVQQANPVTGPIAVVGAEPGDALEVHIRRIEVAPTGYTRTRPAHGVLAHHIRGSHTQIIPIDRTEAVFAGKLKLTLRPMIGTIGVAPAREPVPTLLAGQHGGNLDHNGISEEGIVYLPVYVPGALLSLGDGHALMGDGELTGTGIEVATTTTIQIELLKNIRLARPWVRHGECFSAIGFGADTDAAISDAALAITELLAKQHDLAFEDAYLLTGLVGDGALCQTCQHPHAPAIVRIEVPWGYINPSSAEVNHPFAMRRKT